MKKVLCILILFVISLTSSYAIEESVELVAQEKSFREKLNDVYYLEIDNTDKPHFLLNEILTKNFDNKSFFDNLQFWGAYYGHTNMNFQDSEPFNANYVYDLINIGLDGKLKNNNADFRVMLNYLPISNRDMVHNLFADVYVATNKIPHHRVVVGNTRPPVGKEGGHSPFLLPFVTRSQIARNFGTVRKLGSRISGDYSLVDYDLGVYSSDTYFYSFFPGAEFVGWINLKPLGKTDGKYGKLTLGGGLENGNRGVSYNVLGAYAGYEYKKWLLDFEYANADGYNGASGIVSNNKADGFYTTLAYKISPKIQALLRYDEFDPNKQVAKNNKKEYSAGINYFMKGQALKFVLNYVYCENKSAKNSHRIVVGTQLLL